jgi:ribonucleoside-diphosphate reductase alpha chain
LTDTGHSNGISRDGHESRAEIDVSYRYERHVATLSGALDAQLSEMMGDAPFCDNCGHITVRNGSCYRCLNCGNSLGCS